MADDRRCPRCGQPLTPDVTTGTCPACRLRAGLETGARAAPLNDSHDGEVTFGFEPTSPGRVLESLAHSIGSIPRVLLPDTAPDDRDVAVIKPSSDEMPPPGRRGDRYQLFGEIARGGMGAVLKGRDADLGRDLAVKVLLEAHREKPELLRRFVEEAQIGGQLQHPGIVPVYELGTFADSRPYFTMKLVKGRTLAALLHDRDNPHDELPRFLGIVEQVCQTVAYAHARGVIHRDLKPANVMVGNFGEVQVMDWGLAKVLKEGGVADEPSATPEPRPEVSVIQTVRSGSKVDDSQAGSMLGTPAYMAPEQAGGEIEHVDRRADVFGLGSILCEVLTGRPAYTGRSFQEVVRKAMRGNTGDALARLDACGAEPELIALARDCLSAEPEDRPRDAGAVAARMSAYLSGVQERLRAAELARVEADARAQEERKRRKLALALAAAVLALVTIGGTGSAVYWQQRRDQGARLDLALREVTLLRGQAESNPEGDPGKWQAAVAAAQRAEDLLGPLIDGPSRREVQALQKQVGEAAQAAGRDANLLHAVVDIRSAEADDPNGSASDAAYAAAFRDAGLDLDALGPETAAAKIRARPAGLAMALAAALDDWANQRRKARPKDSEGWRRLIATARTADPDKIRDQLREAWSQPDAKARRGPLLELARQADPRTWPPASLTLLGDALAEAGEHEAAAGLLRRAQAHYPSDVWLNYDLGRELEAVYPPRTEEAIGYYTAARALRPETGHELAHALEERGRSAEATAVFQDLVVLRPGNGRHWSCLGNLLKLRGDRAGADAALDKAVAALREAIRLMPDFAYAHANLGVALMRQGKLDEAIAEDREAIRLRPDDGTTHFNLGTALGRQGKRDEAIVEFREAIRLQPDHAAAHVNLGNVLDGQGKLDEAIVEFREAIRLKPNFAHSNLGNALRRRGKLDEAIAEYREAIRLKPDDHIDHYNLGDSMRSLGKLGEAIAEYREAIRLNPDYAYAHSNLGIALLAQGKVDESIAAHREAIRLNPNYPNIPNNLAWALALTPDRPARDYDEAAALAGKAIDLEPKSGGSYNTLALAEYRRGRWDDAIAAAERSVKLMTGVDVSNWFFLAMAHARKGERDKATTWFDTAVALTKEKGPNDAELLRFWVEAAKLLGRQGPADERR
jgi:tetratricopeptide (TPR) repeat protein/serine/threonine protein kinase